MELLPEKPTANDPNSNRWNWINVGDVIEGLYIDYEPSAGKYNKPQLTLKTPTGKKFVDVPRDLQRRVEGPAKRGDLDGKWMRLEYIEEKKIEGREHPAKIIKPEVFNSAAECKQMHGAPAQHRTVQAPKPAEREAGDDSDQPDPPF